MDVLVKERGLTHTRFTRFYGYPELNQRHLSWKILKSIGKNVKEEWIIGGILKWC